eukprot:33466-Eustigmatos_ZCMA.PRE.1
MWTYGWRREGGTSFVKQKRELWHIRREDCQVITAEEQLAQAEEQWSGRPEIRGENRRGGFGS